VTNLFILLEGQNFKINMFTQAKLNIKKSGDADETLQEEEKLSAVQVPDVSYKLRDISQSMVKAWQEEFAQYADLGVEVRV
jgi:hypothetical protein